MNGITVLYEDRALVVCVKPPELLSEQCDDAKNSLADLLAEENGGYIGVVHRLDRGVGGVMVYAKTPDAAAKLCREVQERTFEKQYLALVHGSPEPESGTLRDLLFHDRRQNKTYVVERQRTGVKEAILDYATLKYDAEGGLSLVRVWLRTGRTHQIRAQFSSRGWPLAGDGKYGARDRGGICLFSEQVAFFHPGDGREMTFSAKPEWLPEDVSE